MAKFLVPLLLMFSLSACDYDADTLPDYVTIDYELAFPIADTTFGISDFFQYNGIPTSQITIPEGTTINLTTAYPFYLSGFSESGYEIFWIEPKALINNLFPSIVDINLTCYISTLSYQPYMLANKQPLLVGENTLFTETHIEASEPWLAEANDLYIVLELTAKKDTSVQELLESTLGVSFGLKVALQIYRTL